MIVGAAAMAADLPKEGTSSVTYSAVGTGKVNQIGKDRFITAFDENGLTVGTGLLDHMTWHCFGLFDVMSGAAQYQGYCVATDPAGDQIVSNNVSDGKYPVDAKSSNGISTFTTGTGEFAGISGGGTFTCRGSEFRSAEGTFAGYCTDQVSYKLP
jgi:hypothetical protein